MSDYCRGFDAPLWAAGGRLVNVEILCEGHGRWEQLNSRGYARRITWPVLKRYAFLGLVNSATVYAVYTPYVFLWVRYSWFQYVRWLEGGIVMSLAFGWLFALVMLQAARWFDGRGA